MGKSQGNIPQTVKHPRPGTEGSHSFPGAGKTEEDTLFLRQREPGGGAAWGSRVTDTQLVSEKQQGVRGEEAAGPPPCSPCSASRWLTPTRSQGAGAPRRCSPWGPPLGHLSAGKGCAKCSRQEESRQRPRHTAQSTRGGPTAPSPKQQGVGTGVSGEGTGLGRAGGEQTCRPPWSHRVRPPAVSVSISNLYPGCEHVSVRSRSMMFEPGLTRGTLEVLVAPPQHLHCEAEDQSIKAIDIQNAYLNGTVARALHGSIS